MPLQIIRNDLTRMACDAVVNPTDEQLSGSGGLDAQLHRAAGPALDRACAALGRCEPGEAVLTEGFDLPSRSIIHTVGPRWVDGDHGERETLASCYRAALALALEQNLSSIAFPIIAAGTFGFPKAEALEIAVREIRAFLSEHEMEVFLVVFNRECYEISAERHARVQSFIDQTYVDARTGLLNHRRSESAPVSFEQAVFSSRDEAPSAPAARPASRPARPQRPRPSAQAEDLFRPDRALDETFSQMLLRKIDESGMTDAQCYKKANVSRKLFSKIRNDPYYRPSKPTAVAFALALELDLNETREMLMKAGFALSHSQRFDVIIEYFIRERVFDVLVVNETLFDFDQQLLGGC